jgi:hypothetical protein
MGAKQLDLTNQKFNKLTVIRLLKSVKYGNTKKRVWECKCDCGNITKINTSPLVRGIIKTCGCSFKDVSRNNSVNSRHKVAKKDAPLNSIYASYRSNAKSRNYVFELNKEEFKILINSNCFYCGQEPLNIFNKTYYNLIYNGIDRIDNEVGYTTNNTVACCKMCNISKNNHTTEYFLNWIKKAYNHNFIHNAPQKDI